MHGPGRRPSRLAALAPQGDGDGAEDGSARSGTLRQERDALTASTQDWAAFSPAARISGFCLFMKSSRRRSVAPLALDTRCHLIASTGSAGTPRPETRIWARRFCAIALPLRAARVRKAAEAASSL